MHNTRIKAKARWEAGRLFLRLRNKPQNEGVIKVFYAERFPRGECLVSIMWPINEMDDANFKKVMGVVIAAYLKCHHSPVIVNSRRKTCLRTIYRFRGIRQGEKERLLRTAKELARWAESVFEMPATVSSVSGIVGLRWRMRALK
ncbi:hypothetical protein A3A36_02360 [Candidatus Kaiserbacteria bacterium RIFCSPLOWO2_01_FULL_52_12b]|uniref:Uncharacterized protein n=1 Tax=Candidatus Kaiserbacteria bacterium RIFCSPLOWO2_01_FULL_52_12b TaxID=1798509 RepID=A0A1F6EW87_9BACT|nr:MAG: hypothetical protein A3A36_02360 [Candidatus Kaiserbacteria bacterium RIFCSPLOWO2_01_FULL_52_12b]